MSDDDLKSRLLNRTGLPEKDIELEGFGVLRVRALSRAEAMLVQNEPNAMAKDRKTIEFGLLDPKMTNAEIKQWQMISPAGELETVTDAIGELSGVVTKAKAKGVYEEFEADRSAEFRTLPSAEVEPNSERTAAQFDA